MKNYYLLLALLSILFWNIPSQAIVIKAGNEKNNTNYEIHIELVLHSISTSGKCDYKWYNYNLNYSYEIQLVGKNAPSSMWYMASYVISDDGTHYIGFPSKGGASKGTSGSYVSRYASDCATATPESLGNDSVRLVINGPNVPVEYQDFIVSIKELDPSALPVELMYFRHNWIENTLMFEWATASEINNSHFTLEYAPDGNDFIALDRIEGHGNSTEIHTYKYAVSRLESTGYYRLRQTDFDGTEDFSAVIYVNAESEKVKLVNPNPAGTKMHLIVPPALHSCEIQIFNIHGTLVSTTNAQSFMENAPMLERGMYIIRISNQSGYCKELKLLQQ